MGSAAARAAGLFALAGAIASACVFGGTFVCSGDGECPSGRCEPSGFCSFPDDACKSGHRYSEWAGEGLADACAPASSDDESGAAGSSSDSGSSTTFAPDLGPPADRNPSTFECGNGELEVGEICDDGNLVDGDGCDADCVASGAVLWTVVEDGPNSGDDFAHAVALTDGNPIVTGRYGQNAGDLFVKHYASDDGTLVWQKLQGTSKTEEGRGVAATDGARFYVVGFNTGTADDENVFTRAYDLVPDVDPDTAWTKSPNDTNHFDDRLYAAAVRADRDELLVFGFMRAPDDTTTHVRALTSSTGDIAWSITPDVDKSVAQIADEARAAIVSSEGRVFVVGTITDPGVGGKTDGWLAELDVSTSPTGVAFGTPVRLGTPTASDVTRCIAEAPDGTLVVAGHRGYHGFFARYDRDLQPLADHEPDPTSVSEVLGIAVDGTGAIVTAGYITSDAHGMDIEVVKYLADGTRVWRDREVGNAGEDDSARGLAIAPDDAIVVVGNLRQTVTGSDLWVRKYAP
ncbi:MAG TPA: hypothetical protein VG755_06770 [Nannocystaceae bacterium]|nr:hypothetical protein [Nannocystaceae bacterium]